MYNNVQMHFLVKKKKVGIFRSLPIQLVPNNKLALSVKSIAMSMAISD